MKRYTTALEISQEIVRLKEKGARIGFVPTMGALHEGHLSLARTLRDYADVRVCSVFVNPTQFNDPKDYEAYKINLERDAELLSEEGVDILFAPVVAEIYPPGFQSTISVGEISKPFEGAHRPGHFNGVATVVSILFNIVRPDVAIFGEKDFQQLRLIERMVSDLKMGIQIVRGALVRDEYGLALSSRNARLSPLGRRDALALSRGLRAAQEEFAAGERSGAVLQRVALAEIEKVPGAVVDYIAVIDEESLEPVSVATEDSRVLMAVTVEGVRLLDNARVSPETMR